MSLGGGGAEPTGLGLQPTGDPMHDADLPLGRRRASPTWSRPATPPANAGTFVPAAYDEVITVSALADFDGRRAARGAPTCRADQSTTRSPTSPTTAPTST